MWSLLALWFLSMLSLGVTYGAVQAHRPEVSVVMVNAAEHAERARWQK